MSKAALFESTSLSNSKFICDWVYHAVWCGGFSTEPCKSGSWKGCAGVGVSEPWWGMSAPQEPQWTPIPGLHRAFIAHQGPNLTFLTVSGSFAIAFLEISLDTSRANNGKTEAKPWAAEPMASFHIFNWNPVLVFWKNVPVPALCMQSTAFTLANIYRKKYIYAYYGFSLQWG